MIYSINKSDDGYVYMTTDEGDFKCKVNEYDITQNMIHIFNRIIKECPQQANEILSYLNKNWIVSNLLEMDVIENAVNGIFTGIPVCCNKTFTLQHNHFYNIVLKYINTEYNTVVQDNNSKYCRCDTCIKNNNVATDLKKGYIVFNQKTNKWIFNSRIKGM